MVGYDPRRAYFFEDEELSFNLLGTQKYFQISILLNHIHGFDEFLHRQGYFAFGFQNAKPDPWSENLQRLIENGPFEDDEKISWRKWIDRFECKYGITPTNKGYHESRLTQKKYSSHKNQFKKFKKPKLVEDTH